MKIKFRRWHERRLYVAFGWLTTCLLSGVLLAAIYEFVGLNTPGLTPLITIAVIYGIGVLGIESFRRFWQTLSHAQFCASKATCAQCDTYGLFEVVPDSDYMLAVCLKCGYRWTIVERPSR